MSSACRYLGGVVWMSSRNLGATRISRGIAWMLITGPRMCPHRAETPDAHAIIRQPGRLVQNRAKRTTGAGLEEQLEQQIEPAREHELATRVFHHLSNLLAIHRLVAV